MINFQVNGTEMPSIDISKISKWIDVVAADYDMRVGNISYCFCDDNVILENNRQFLGHDYYTDIITFDYTEGNRISGDLLISLDTVRTNSEKFGVTYENELLRVIIHGVLHLCGLHDKSSEERAEMEAAENKALAVYEFGI